MNNNITLNVSMRDNLLSLRNISKQMDKTQLILATGKKVNSAIDNASSYYQARSLTNRAADLTALLDAMSQGIQTIETANAGLEKATAFLEQMSSIVEQAGTVVKIPAKEDIAARLGDKGAVVTTADELYAAINAGKETICVYGHIDLGNIDAADKEINLKEGQKLVGAEYFADGSTGGEKFSSITAESSVASKHLINIKQSGCMVSDLAVNYTNTYDAGNIFAVAIYASGAKNKVVLNNLDVKLDFPVSTSATGRGAITIDQGMTADIFGKVNIISTGQESRGFYTETDATTNINGAMVNIQTTGERGHGIVSNATLNINDGSKVNIQTSSKNSQGVLLGSNGTTNINAGAQIDIKTSGDNSSGISINGTGAICNIKQGADVKVRTLGTTAYGLAIQGDGTANIAGNLYVESAQAHGLFVFIGSNTINILSSATIYIEAKSNAIQKQATSTSVIDIAQGARIAIAKDGNTKWYKLQDRYHDENNPNNVSINSNNVETVLDVAETSAWALPTGIDDADEATDEESNQKNVEAYQSQFNTALIEYDKLINDSSYQGINLLKGGNLRLTFDENREHKFEVWGKDISSTNIGINEAGWQTQVDIENSLKELREAITSLRSFAEELGNNYSIIKTRVNFTEALTDVLETGADDLTLADMNEASAQYLTLQTRQQLAINSLSLASQSAQSVLRLF